MADIDIGQSPPAKIIIPFYATGSIAFGMFCVLLFISADSLTGHYFNPHLLTIVHTAALGWATMVIFGAAYQLLPVICERNLFSNQLALLSWYFLCFGTILLAGSFWNFRTGWLMITGGTMVVLAAIFYSLNAFFTGGVCKNVSTVKVFIITSAIWLLITTLIGLLLAVNLSFPFFSRNHLEILKLHAHAGLAGWFLQLVSGVSSKLIPMFLLGKSGKIKMLRLACMLQNTGLLLFLLDAYCFGISRERTFAYALIAGAGVLCWLYYLYDAFRNRMRKKIDVQMKHSFISLCCLLLSFCILPLLLYFRDSRWVMLYGTLLFMGWITGIILGKTFKTLPFIIWNEQYKHLSGKMKIPMPKDLYSQRLVSWQFRAYVIALPALLTGLLLHQVSLIRAGLGLWIAVSVFYLLNVFKVLTHKKNL